MYFLLLSVLVHFPLESGQYPAVVFVGGLNGLVIVEVYSTILQRIASHGFFVFGLDYRYPVETLESGGKKLKQDISKFFDEITFVCFTHNIHLDNSKMLQII